MEEHIGVSTTSPRRLLEAYRNMKSRLKTYEGRTDSKAAVVERIEEAVAEKEAVEKVGLEVKKCKGRTGNYYLSPPKNYDVHIKLMVIAAKKTINLVGATG